MRGAACPDRGGVAGAMSRQRSHDPICPDCGARESRVEDVRESHAGSVRRRRLCICGKRLTSYEQVADVPRFRALWLAITHRLNH